MKAELVNGKRGAATDHTTTDRTAPESTASQATATLAGGVVPFEGLDRSALLDVHRCMVRSRKIDDKEIQLKNQSLTFFQISGAGHEAVLVATGLVLRPGYDWVHAYYRDRALALQLGVTPLDMLLGSVGAAADPSNGGRQMPSHWGDRARNIVPGSSATTTQLLQAVGCAEAGRIYGRVSEIPDRASKFHDDEIVYASLGEGSTSEGEFWEAVSAACTGAVPRRRQRLCDFGACRG